jgi:inhibitor of KinA
VNPDRISPLGDQAVLAYFADEATAFAFGAAVREAAPPWLEDVVPVYSSVGVFFDSATIETSEVVEWLKVNGGRRSPELSLPRVGDTPRSPMSFTIPVCYDFALDLPRICEHTGLLPEEVIRLHTATEFTVYAIGFVPGFPYMGYLPSELCGVPRLPTPRVRVEPGSVGITGRQTAIYPQASPGGWNLIGRTPLVIVDVAAGFFPLRVGDRVRFERIDETEFRNREGERLGEQRG